MSSASGTADRPNEGAITTELREYAPLNKWSNVAGRGACADPRSIASFFCVLSVAITIALFTQIYYGDFEVSAHGSVASSAAVCSRAGTGALRAGGGALDAAAAAALCLAVVAPHRAGFDASGSLMLWDYRRGRSQPPLVAEWGGANRSAESKDALPRLLGALAFLHARFGRLPWSEILQPAIDLVMNRTSITNELVISLHLDLELPLEDLIKTQNLTRSKLAAFLVKLQQNTSHQLAEAWSPNVTITDAKPVRLADWIIQLPASQPAADAAVRALSPLFENDASSSMLSTDDLTVRLAGSMKRLQTENGWPQTGVATGIAVIDTRDVYVSLVMGLSDWLGTKQLSTEGWLRDDKGSLPPPPTILAQEQTCGQRYVVGAGDTAALVQVVGALTLTRADLRTAVEQPRTLPLLTGGLGLESWTTPASPGLLATLTSQGIAQNILQPYPSVNVVQQTGDDLGSHADSRGGGHASRF